RIRSREVSRLVRRDRSDNRRMRPSSGRSAPEIAAPARSPSGRRACRGRCRSRSGSRGRFPPPALRAVVRGRGNDIPRRAAAASVERASLPEAEESSVMIVGVEKLALPALDDSPRAPIPRSGHLYRVLPVVAACRARKLPLAVMKHRAVLGIRKGAALADQRERVLRFRRQLSCRDVREILARLLAGPARSGEAGEQDQAGYGEAALNSRLRRRR